MTEVPSRPVPGPRPEPSTAAGTSSSPTPSIPTPSAYPDGEPARPAPAPHPVPGPALDGTDRSLAGLEADLRPLDTLSARPVDEHPAVFEAVHEALQRTLAESDS